MSREVRKSIAPDPESMRLAGLEALCLAGISLGLAKTRKNQVREMARRHLQRQEHANLSWYKRRHTRLEDVPVSPLLLRVTTDTWVVKDPVWINHMSDNRWYLEQATAYGVNAQANNG